MNPCSEDWQTQERQVITAFFDVKVVEVLGELADTCTERSCVEFAKQILRASDLEPVHNQGCNSFTLVSHQQSKIVQFRLRPFDTTIIDLAHQIYGTQVPRTEFYGGFPLPVYNSDVIPGKVHVLQQFPEEFPLERQKRTVVDLGRFVAKAAHYPQPKASYREDSWTLKAKETLIRLQRNESLREIPDIGDIVLRLLDQIHLLDLLPVVLKHHDFSEVNILVDDAGNVTGVIDFDVAGIEAFGMCIWGVYECFLGSMNQGK
jgi:hypothetical protein